MGDRDRDKEQLINELINLHKKNAELENVKANHKQTEKKLAKSEKLYRLIAESTSDVISLATFNLHPVYTYVSSSVKVSTGYEPEELLGKSPFEFIHPDDKKKLFPMLKDYFNTKIKKLLTGKELPTTKRIEFRFRDKEGNWRYLQSVVNIVGNKLLFITRDITEHQKIMDKLKKSEEKYRNLFENMPGAYYRTDREGNFIMINPEGIKLFGYNSLEDILGKNIDQHFYSAPEERKKYLKELEKNKGNLKDFELTLKKKDGTPLIISDTSHFYYDKDENIAGVEGIFVDITERKKIKEDLQRSQQEFASLFESSPEALVYLDKKGIIVDANLRFCKLFGYSLKEIKGRNLDDGMIHSSDKIKEGKKLTVNGLKGYLNYETIRRKKDGTLFPVSISATPLVIDGQAKGEIGIYIDITERKQSEEALHKSQQEFSSLFKSSPEALIYIDEKSKILDINSQFTKLFGYALKEIKGKNVNNGIIHSQKMIHEGKNLTKKALEGFVNYETIRKRKDGSEFPVFISSAPVKINNKLKGIITLYQDITERRKAEEKLRQSEEKFAGIFKNIPDVAFYLDTEGIILDVNPNFTRLLGYTKKEILGKDIDEVGLYPKGKMKEGKDLTRKILNKNLTNFETIRRKKDGTPIPVHISTSLVKIKDKVTGIIVLYHDITERKQSEKIQKVVYNISKAANSPISLNQLYKTIHKELGTIIDTTNFYIALVNEREDKICFPYHQDEMDDNFPILKFSTTDTLTTYVVKTGRPLLNNNKQYNEMAAQGIITPMGSATPQNIWLGVPLKIEDKTIGAMVVQSYTNPNLYSEKDTKLLEFVSSQVATAIERKSSEERIKHLSFHDVLTGLYNRAYFEEELERYNFPRYYPLSIVMFDVNGLKVINDTFGHSEGDRLLQHLSQILTSVSRQGDILARIGGDEFAILLPSTTSEQAHNFCERIKKACHQDKIEPVYLRPNISLGHTTQEGEYKDINSLLKEADRNMYQDKLFNGKSREKHFLEAFRIILAERDPHTSDHAQRLQELALSLGKRVGLTEYQLGNLKLLALLHDMGKIGIPDSILFKTYILTHSEWKKMREHPRIGYRMAKNIPDFSPIAQEILYHHEYWDGTGYPDGLKGEKIPLLSRIISIIDTYDVMQSRRPYKGPISKTEAIKEIKRCAGTQFDPQLVEIFLKIENDKK